MCGRARVARNAPQIAESVDVPLDNFHGQEDFIPMYNAYPGTVVPVMYQDDGGSAAVRSAYWGLVPSFTRRDQPLKFFFAFNARSETIAQRPMFKRLCETKRCVVVVDGFYEWKLENGVKVPYLVQSQSGAPLLMAGLYDVYRPSHDQATKLKEGLERRKHAFETTKGWTVPSTGQDPGAPEDEEGGAAGPAHEDHEGSAGEGSGQSTQEGGSEQLLYSCTILTCTPGKQLSWLHDRMPVILTKEQARQWVDVRHNHWPGTGQGDEAGHARKKVKHGHDDAHGSSSSSTSAAGQPAPVDLSFMLRPYEDPADPLVWHACSRRMNSLAYQGSDAGDPCDPSKDPFQATPTKGKAKAKGSTGAGAGGTAESGASASASPNRGPGTLHGFFKAAAKSSGQGQASSSSAATSDPAATATASAASAGADTSKLPEATGHPGAGKQAGHKRRSRGSSDDVIEIE